MQRGLQKMPYKTSLAVVFFSALVAVAMSGSLVVSAPLVWEQAANRSQLTVEQFATGQSAGGLGILLGALPGILVDRATPMLCAFLFAAEAFAGYFVLFFVANGLLVVSSWVVIGVLFFLVGQAALG